MASGSRKYPIVAVQIEGEKVEVVMDFFLGSKINTDCDFNHEIKWQLLLGRKAVTNLDSVLKSKDITLLTKVHIVKALVFPMVMYGCENWATKRRKTKELIPLNCGIGEHFWKSFGQQGDQMNLKEDQPWIFTGRTDAEAPVFWSSDAQSWLIGKVLEAGTDWVQKEKRVSEDEMAGWHHWCNEHELEQTSGDSEGQGGLACCSPWGLKELDMTGCLNNNNNNLNLPHFLVSKVSPIFFFQSTFQTNSFSFIFNALKWVHSLTKSLSITTGSWL